MADDFQRVSPERRWALRMGRWLLWYCKSQGTNEGTVPGVGLAAPRQVAHVLTTPLLPFDAAQTHAKATRREHGCLTINSAT